MNKNGKFCSKITSKNIPRGEKEIGSRLKMEREKFISLSLAPPSNETFSRTALSKNKMFVSATNRAERGVVQFRRLKTEVCTECSKKYDSKKISLKLISEQFNFALDSQLVKLSRLF